MKRHSISPLFIALFLVSGSTGCGVLIGNVKPPAEKSGDYQVNNLQKENSDWVKLDPKDQLNPPRDYEEEQTQVSDLSFQSQSTASIISINSACRPRVEKENQDLKTITSQLLLGITDISSRDEKDLTVSETPALETTVEGKLNNEAMKLRTVVLKRGRCIYDLMYVSRPNHFQTQELDFTRFVSSLRLE